MANDKGKQVTAAAETPITPAAIPTTPTVDLSDPSAVLDAKRIVFAHPKGKNDPITYKDGRTQRNLADASVEIGQTGMMLRGRVVAVITPNSRQVAVEFKFVTTGTAAYRQPVVEYADPDAKARAEDWKISAVKAFQIWYQKNKASKVQSATASGGSVIVDLADLGLS